AFNSRSSGPQGVLANDTVDPGLVLTPRVIGGPSHGSLTLNPDGSFTYTPASGYSRPDSLTYKANDGTFDSNLATVSLTVGGPVPSPETYSTYENQALTVNAPGVLGNDANPGGGTLTPLVAAAPYNGTLTLNPDGSFTYTPRTGFY